MSVYRDKDNRWRYRASLRLPSGARERISGTPQENTRAAAQQYEREHIDRVLHPERHPVGAAAEQVTSGGQPAPEGKISGAGTGVAFSAFAATWLATYPPATNKQSTVDHRRQHIDGHLIPYWKDTPLDQIRNEQLVAFVGVLKATRTNRNSTGPRALKKPRERTPKMLAQQTILNILRTLHKILIDALEWGKLAAVPRFPKVLVPPSQWDWLTSAEGEALITPLTDPEDTAKILFALRTGARQSEQLAIEWDDVNFSTHMVRIDKQIYRGQRGSTKSNRERSVPMAPKLEAALKRARHLRGPLVFCGPSGEPLTADELQGTLERALRRAKIRKVCWHDLRHSFASQLVSAGVNLRQVQEWLGHSTIQTTMRYAHLAPTDGPRLIAALDASA